MYQVHPQEYTTILNENMFAQPFAYNHFTLTFLAIQARMVT